MAHAGGTLFGVVLCLLLLLPQLLPRDQFDVLALIQRWNKRRQYRDLVAQGYDPFGVTPGKGRRGSPPPIDPNFERVQTIKAHISDALAKHDMPAAARLYIEMKAIDPRQVLSRQAQLDVATQFAHDGQYASAAEAYETFLKQYPNYEQIEQIELMVGLIYARYLNQYEPARRMLSQALSKLHGSREVDLAKTELARIEPLIASSSAGT